MFSFRCGLVLMHALPAITQSGQRDVPGIFLRISKPSILKIWIRGMSFARSFHEDLLWTLRQEISLCYYFSISRVKGVETRQRIRWQMVPWRFESTPEQNRCKCTGPISGRHGPRQRRGLRPDACMAAPGPHVPQFLSTNKLHEFNAEELIEE